MKADKVDIVLYPRESAESAERAKSELATPDPTPERAMAALRGEEEEEEAEKEEKGPGGEQAGGPRG